MPTQGHGALQHVLHMSSSSSGRSDSNGGRASAAVQQSKDNEKQTGSKGDKAKLDLASPKGTRDFYPDDKRLSNWLFGVFRDIARRYSFEEYDAPVVENEDLYIRKAGEEVTEQLYNFEDKGGRRLSLRPEMTPSLARMVMAQKKALAFPIKWFSIPQCWRYERMTLGRRREHYQWNMDIWGIAGVEAEAELLAAAVSAFKEMKLSSADVGVKINSRKILQAIVELAKVPTDKFAATCVLIDKLEKVPLEALLPQFEAIGVSKQQVNEIVTNIALKDVDAYKALLGADCDGVKDMELLFSLATAYGYADWLVFDPSVVRGLAYYTGMVFEGFDRGGKFRAIMGGGRYDTLLETFGGEAVPAVGFGFGDAVIVEMLKSKELLPDTATHTASVVVYALTESLRTEACGAVEDLRAQGMDVEFILLQKKPKWVFSHADKLKAKYVVIFGENEFANKQVQVKNMADGTQEAVDIASLVTTLSSA